jgi:SagB-type dehydrogenase family enzyme
VTAEKMSSDVADDEVLSALINRSSFNKGKSQRPVSKSELFAILRATYRVNSTTQTRPVPSAGQKYPLELYPLVVESPDINSGLYHYNPGQDVLERPGDTQYLKDKFGPYDEFLVDNWQHLENEHKISVMFLITGIPPRSGKKYGERGYLFTLIEVGSVIQSIQLSASRFGIGSRPYAGFRYDVVADLLGLVDHSREWVLTSIALADTDTTTDSG